MFLDPTFVANTLLFLLMASLQLGAFGDLLGEDDDAGNDTENDLDPLFDASLYTQRIDGTPGDDVIGTEVGQSAQAYFLQAGDDTLQATPGNDFIDLGDGNDFAEALEGDDIVQGRGGDDRIFAGRGNDQIFGGMGNDLLEGSLGDDVITGGAGNDQLSGGRDDDRLLGGDGDDILSGDRFDQTGGAERGTDALFGEAGDDTLWLVGNDSGTGGEGADLFRVFDSETPNALVTIEDFDAADDQIEVIYVPESGEPAPELTVRVPTDTTDAVVALDGVDVATVKGAVGLSVEDISLTTNIPTA